MAEGDVKLQPKTPDFSAGWGLGKPDLVVSMDKAYSVPATGRDIYANFTIPVNLPEDKWVTAVDVKPSSQGVLHHTLMFAAGKDSGKGGKGGGGGIGGGAGGIGGLLGGGLGGGSLGGYVPGTRAQHLPMELAMPFPKGSNISLQTHFHPNGKAQQEKTTLALYFAKKKPERTLVTFQTPVFFGALAGINIPAGKKDWKLQAKFTAPCDMELVSVMGHAHNICESMKGTAKLPDGTVKSLVYIPHWDFNWQSTYQYKESVKLPKGTVIDVVLIYNNSSENPANPFNPPKHINWGQTTSDEMGSLIFNCVAQRESDTPVLRQATSGLGGLTGGGLGGLGGFGKKKN